MGVIRAFNRLLALKFAQCQKVSSRRLQVTQFVLLHTCICITISMPTLNTSLNVLVLYDENKCYTSVVAFRTNYVSIKACIKLLLILLKLLTKIP